ncbi:MAG TPA: uroporphyrinogen-III synthase [Methylomirabilota bacterium]|nr:uroporphyrinogen-III synthase [Methylomirabilota bacterium]
MTPLDGRRIVVTRAAEQAGELADALAARGADVVIAPTIRIEPLPGSELGALRAALLALTGYRWIVFTSRNAVRVVTDRMAEWRLGTDALARAPVAAIGPATAAALVERGVTPEVVPPRFVAEAVVEALAARGGLAGARILLPRALDARDALPAGLRQHGATVEIVPVYRTVTADGGGDARGLAADLLDGRIDAVTFTSSSTVRHFVDLVGADAATCGRFTTAVIGPVTADTARELGLVVGVEAEVYTVPGLVDALVRHFT